MDMVGINGMVKVGSFMVVNGMVEVGSLLVISGMVEYVNKKEIIVKVKIVN